VGTSASTVQQLPVIAFRSHPERYRHWRLEIEPPIATLTLDVQEDGGLQPGYVLKLNSYDLGVDIELCDAVQRLRFEHPEVRAVVVTGGKEKVFCAGANIGMLAQSTHPFKVNFCKFTNETRLAIEDATENSGQTYLCALNGTASGGGYEIALATDHIVLVDDGSSAISLPELPLLAVLPGTGGLTRLVDKRGIRRDIADVFATRAEGVKGQQALAWGLVDEVVTRSSLDETVRERALERASPSTRPPDAEGITLGPLEQELTSERIGYPHVTAEIDRTMGVVAITVTGPADGGPSDPSAIAEAGSAYWPLAVARELDDLVLHLRFNEPELGTITLRTTGDGAAVAAVDDVLQRHADDWLVREIVLLWKRTLKRLDVTSRSMFALIEPGSCFAGALFELALLADRSYMLDDEGSTVTLTGMNFGPLPMGNGLTRLQTRFLGDPSKLEAIGERTGQPIGASDALDLGLVTFTPDDLDFEDEVRLALEERASFSPDALTAMESNHRFAGPETLETKIFGRLSCWQNWVFSRPNATGAEGALTRYGSGTRANFDKGRV
jgi:benzoyl-CoA-dihydrodiol lyase